MTLIEALDTIEITVGDTGYTISGTLDAPGLLTLAGASVTFSLLGIDDELRLTGSVIVAPATATVIDPANRKVAYHMQSNDVAKRAVGAVRWTANIPGVGVISFPGERGAYLIVRINP
jgi:hypothetical protein